ncbi:hypothetical protein [Haladaptatus cibarius]|uniref:hypothetical protein n=1 Tax=Haladaptatus cibarius TaxID=453847 RepID=UPI0006798658|nr:hypothetical protein [Haladaptatus cibarius]
MTSRDTVPTKDGEFTVQSGDLRVRTTPRGAVRGIYFENWEGKDKLQQGWFVFSSIFTAVTVGGFINDWLGFSGALLSVGFVISLLFFYVAAGVLMLVNGRLRTDVSIPLRTIREVEHNEKQLELAVGEFEDVETTEIEFPHESDAEKAIELLRWKGIRITELGEEKTNLRTEIDRELERETT